MGRLERKTLIERLETARQSKVICYLTSDRQNANAQVKKDVMPLLYEHLHELSAVERVDVLLFTNGGDTLAAFGLSRLLREFASEVRTLVPGKCHSAGTLFALGSNQIMMTRGATLSPIDPSITTPLNPVVEFAPGQRQAVPLSVESVAGFKALVTEDWGLKGEDSLAGAFKFLADRVNPLALGDVFRARQQIELLATKLLGQHRSDEKNIARIVTTLTKELGSHDYLISRREARELLGDQVAPNDHDGENLIWDLYRDFAEEMALGETYDPAVEHRRATAAGAAGPHRVVLKLAVVESSVMGHACEREEELGQVQLPLPGIPGAPAQKVTTQEVVRSGWVRYA